MENIESEEPRAPGIQVNAPVHLAYDSHWVEANRTTNHNMKFEHKLGKAPHQMFVLFSPDKKEVHPVIWPWAWNVTGNPTSIWCDDTYVYLSIFSGTFLHGYYSGDANNNAGGWIEQDSGYFRVLILDADVPPKT